MYTVNFRSNQFCDQERLKTIAECRAWIEKHFQTVENAPESFAWIQNGRKMYGIQVAGNRDMMLTNIKGRYMTMDQIWEEVETLRKISRAVNGKNQQEERAETVSKEENKMLTVEDIDAMIKNQDWEAYNALAYSFQKNTERLETIYGETINGTPEETIKKFVETVGYSDAVKTIASLVNQCAWDGRISHSAAAWAESVENALNEDAAQKLHVYTNRIHRAHLDQLAAAMKKYPPETEESRETIPAEAAADAEETAQAVPTFTAHAVKDNAGKSFPVTYHMYAGAVIAQILADGKTLTVTIDEQDPYYIQAFCAAQEAERIAQVEAEAEKERQKEERRAARAADPDKQAHGPIPEKSWIGETIRGLGYTIEFSATYDRTRIIFDDVPTDAAKAIVKENGFYYSPALKSWNRGLNWKAYRAALKVQEAFARMKEIPCKVKRRAA